MTIFTAEKNNVLSVPSKALRYTPTVETIGKKYKIQDCQGKNKVWTLEGNVIKAHAVQIGISDGSRTEIISGISNGTQVITELKEIMSESEGEATQSGTERSPFAPGPPGKNKKK